MRLKRLETKLPGKIRFFLSEIHISPTPPCTTESIEGAADRNNGHSVKRCFGSLTESFLFYRYGSFSLNDYSLFLLQHSAYFKCAVLINKYIVVAADSQG